MKMLVKYLNLLIHWVHEIIALLEQSLLETNTRITKIVMN